MATTFAATINPVVGDPGYLLRLPPELKAKLKEWAQAEHRSLNAQIVHVLERAWLERDHESGAPGGERA